MCDEHAKLENQNEQYNHSSKASQQSHMKKFKKEKIAYTWHGQCQTSICASPQSGKSFLHKFTPVNPLIVSNYYVEMKKATRNKSTLKQ